MDINRGLVHFMGLILGRCTVGNGWAEFLMGKVNIWGLIIMRGSFAMDRKMEMGNKYIKTEIDMLDNLSMD
jgi:hypothetical protein